MKKLILISLIASNGLLLANSVNECSVNLFYGNGMRNENGEPHKTLRQELKPLVKQRITNQKILDRLNYDVSVNYKEDFLIETLEVLDQWYVLNLKLSGSINDPINRWGYREVDCDDLLMPDPYILDGKCYEKIDDYNFHNIMANIDNSIPPSFWKHTEDEWNDLRNTIHTKLAEISNLQRFQDADLSKHIKRYKSDIANSNREVLISHSQGNFYGNLAYGNLDVWERDYFKMISVATPASYVSGGGDWTTLYSDKISLVPNSLNSNIGNTNAYYNTDLNMTIGEGHAFVMAYLKGDNYNGLKSQDKFL